MNVKPLGWVVILLATTSGCMSLKQSYVEKHQFALEAVRTGAPLSLEKTFALKIRPVLAAPMCESASLARRVDENRYESDFYNVFFMPASDQLTECIRQWLTQAGFQTIPPASRMNADLVLESLLTSLHGDYRNPAQPAAVMALEAAVVDVRSATPRMVFQKAYARTIPLNKAAAADLVEGWNQALASILAELESDLKVIAWPD